ncbi:hypothetical protein NC652_026264 [Populus alba x Populus x berolinensis]|nr:hypothetical protein NC652_026264 [Populus alba x Populus x berolinensis]
MVLPRPFRVFLPQNDIVQHFSRSSKATLPHPPGPGNYIPSFLLSNIKKFLPSYVLHQSINSPGANFDIVPLRSASECVVHYSPGFKTGQNIEYFAYWSSPSLLYTLTV